MKKERKSLGYQRAPLAARGAKSLYVVVILLLLLASK